MPSIADADPSGRLRLQRGVRVRRLLIFLKASGVVCVVLGMAAGAVLWRLGQGPISFDGLASSIAGELNSRFTGYEFALGAASLENGAHGPSLSVNGFSLRDSEGRTIITAPRAEVSVAALPLITGSMRPTRLNLVDVDLRLTLLADGGVALSAGDAPLVFAGASPASAEAGPGAATQSTPMRDLAFALHKLVAFATEPESSIGSLERVGVTGGRLTFERAASGETTVLNGLNLSFDKHKGRASVSISAEGPRGRWSGKVQVVGDAGAERSLEVELTDISDTEISLITGARNPDFGFENPLSARLRFTLGQQGEISGATGAVSIGAGEAKFGAEEGKTLFLDEVTGKLRWNVGMHRLDFDGLQFVSGETQIAVNGSLAPPRADGEPWRIEARSENAVVVPEKPGAAKLGVDTLVMSANLFAADHTIVVDRLEARGPQVDVTATGEAGWRPDAHHLKVKMSLGRMPSHAVLQLWPKFISPKLREYLIEHVRSGTVERAAVMIDFDAAALASLDTDIPLAEERVRIDYAVTNAALAFLPGVPALVSLDATGFVTGRQATVNATRGFLDASGGKRLTMVDAVFHVPDTNRKPAPANLVARVAGSLETVSEILAREGLKSYGGMQIDTSAMKGQLDGKLMIDLKLAKATRSSDTVVRFGAAINGFSIDRLIGKERFDQGVLNVAVDPAGLKATGQGRIFGAAATLELKKPASGSTDAIVQFTVDEAARTRMGMNFGAGLTGPIGAKLSAPFGKTDAPAHVELDLTRASIDGLLPGLVKLAGRPAKASFMLDASDGPISVGQLVFDAPGGASARGSVELDAVGAFKSAKLSMLRLSPGDDMKVDADQTRDGLKLVVRGNAVDARPFLRGLMGADSSGPKDATASKDIDLDLKTGLVSGYNRQTLTGVDLRLTRKGGAVRSFQLQARSGRSAITGGTPRGREGGIALTTADGGAFLSFLDIYRRMEGGKAQLNARMSDSGLEGSIHITDFILRNEPALRRLVSEGVQARDEHATSRIDTNAASFQRLSATFTRGGGRFVVRDGVLVGQQIGLKLDGTLDTAHDQIAMTGVFVPAYGLNNLFSQIPLFGPILGGDRNEGLFAVNFRISGAASAPVLTINPLSAIAPGFLRKIFGAIDGTGTPTPPENVPLSSQNMPMSIAPAR